MAEDKITAATIRSLGPILKRLAWSDADTRESIQVYGANVLPVNVYSNSPSIQDVRTSYEYADPEAAPYLTDEIFDKEGLDAVLARLHPYAAEFNPPLEGNEDTGEFFWNNSQFSYSDAMVYYCFIRSFRPQTVVEIGSGFSTLVALEAVKRNGAGRIVCVEPFPREFLKKNPDIELVQREAQSLTPAELDGWLSEDGDFLFIDSTHTVKTGSDCLHLYLRLLPRIRRSILVHAHDIFLPFGLPQDWLLNQQIFWTEQYLLLALLTDNPRARVLYGSAYHHAFNLPALFQMMDGKYGCGGSSFWFEYRVANPT
jgi:predicted O-methyltransferase YrrM